MTDRYVDSAAGGANDGTSKTDAFTTLSAALTAAAAGDRIFVSHTNAESTAGSITLTSAGTIDNYVQIFSVDFAGSTPPVHADITAGAVVATGAGAYNITFAGFAISRGIDYRAGVGGSSTVTITNTTAAFGWDFEDCQLYLASSGGSSNISFGGSIAVSHLIRWKNVTLRFSAVGQFVSCISGVLQWLGGGVSADGSAPTTLFSSMDRLTRIYLEGVDLSHMGSGKTIVGHAGANGSVIARRCKLGASVTKTVTPTNHLKRSMFLNCNSGDVNYDNSILDYYGEMTVETTIVLTGGASDGTTPIAHKIVTTANAAPETPFRSMPIEFWNETLSAITITIQGIWGGGAVPDDDEIWLEADYLGTSGFPISSRISDRMASLLSTPAGQAAGSGTWGGSTTKFALSVTLTPAEKGLITLNVMAGAASSTFYYDPKPVIT